MPQDEGDEVITTPVTEQHEINEDLTEEEYENSYKEPTEEQQMKELQEQVMELSQLFKKAMTKIINHCTDQPVDPPQRDFQESHHE